MHCWIWYWCIVGYVQHVCSMLFIHWKVPIILSFRWNLMMTSSNGTFSALLLALCAGHSPVTGEFPSQSQRRGALMFSLICTWANGWANHRDAGDFRRHCAHYNVTVMLYYFGWCDDNASKYITRKLNIPPILRITVMRRPSNFDQPVGQCKAFSNSV